MKVCVLPGDGIGPEVTTQAVKVLQAVCAAANTPLQLQTADIGGIAIDKHQNPLPQATIDACKQSDAVLLGAVGGPKWDQNPSELRPEAGLLGIRASLGLFSNLRPAMIFSPLRATSPLKEEIVGDGVDILIVRELTGGIYFGKKGKEITKEGECYAYDTMEYTESEIRRIAKVAFGLAMQRNKKVTSVDKANVLEVSKLWRKVITEVAADYPQVTLEHLYVDNAAMQLVKNPKQFDVIVTGNMFGDILSDEASMICGSIGMLPSASMGETGFGLYEPVHGSAPDIAGKQLANPCAAILSVAMMLRYTFDMGKAADAIEHAVSQSLLVGRTADIAQDGIRRWSTDEAGSYIAEEAVAYFNR